MGYGNCYWGLYMDYYRVGNGGMGEWVMGTVIGDYMGTTTGIHSPIPE